MKQRRADVGMWGRSEGPMCEGVGDGVLEIDDCLFVRVAWPPYVGVVIVIDLAVGDGWICEVGTITDFTGEHGEYVKVW